MQIDKLMTQLAEFAEWEIEILKQDVVAIKYDYSGRGHKKAFIVYGLGAFNPNYLVLEIDTSIMPLDNRVVDDKNFILKVAQLALTRNMDLRFMRWGLTDSTNGPMLCLKMTVFLEAADSMIEDIEHIFKSFYVEEKDFLESIMTEVVGVSKDSDFMKRMMSA